MMQTLPTTNFTPSSLDRISPSRDVAGALHPQRRGEIKESASPGFIVQVRDCPSPVWSKQNWSWQLDFHQKHSFGWNLTSVTPHLPWPWSTHLRILQPGWQGKKRSEERDRNLKEPQTLIKVMPETGPSTKGVLMEVLKRIPGRRWSPTDMLPRL